MNVCDAAYHVVHDYPGGAASLAPRLGVAPSTLQGKVNPAVASHRLALEEAVRLQAITGDCRILEAMAAELGWIAIPMQVYHGVCDLEVLETYTALMARVGDLSRDLHAALADRRIKPDELERIKADVYAARQAEAELLNRLEQLVEPADRG